MYNPSNYQSNHLSERGGMLTQSDIAHGQTTVFSVVQ